MTMNFGYSVNQPRAINLDRNDLSPAAALVALEASVRTCIECGSCTATCTAGALTDFNFHKLHHLLLKGEYDHVREQTGKCMLCGKCRLVCPRGINTRNLILAIKKVLP